MMDKGLRWYLLIITAFLLCTIGVARAFAAQEIESPMGKVADFLFHPVQSLFTEVKQKTENWFSDITKAKASRAENEKLRETISRMKSEEREVVALRKENARLKALLELQEEKIGYRSVACDIIAQDVSGLSALLRLNKGTRHGLQKKDCVVTTEGVVGKVSAVYENSAMVTPITQVGTALGARIVRSQQAGVLETKEEGLIFSGFSEEFLPVIGDEVETSGIGGVYPEGILLGTVSAVTETGVLLVPAVDIRNVQEVLVLCDKGEKTGA